MTQHWGLRCWFCTTSAALSIGLLIVVVSIGLAACGYNGSDQGSTSSTQSAAQVTHSQAQTTHSQAQVQQCGIVQGPGSLKLQPSDTGAEQAENCFWQAFQHCHPATLIFIRSGVGAVLTHTFTIHNGNGTCSISYTKQQRVVPNPPSVAKISTCTGLVKQVRALRFTACGHDGDVVVSGQ